MKILTWNVGFMDTEGGKLREVFAAGDRAEGILKAIISYDPDIVVLTEFGLKSMSKNTDGEKIIKGLKKKYIWRPQKGCSRNVCDVYIAVKNGFEFSATERGIGNTRSFFSNRWLEITVTGGNLENELNILGIYIPSAEDKDKCKTTFWGEVIKYAEREKGKDAIIIGDFNECLAEDDSNTPGAPTDNCKYLEKLKSPELGWHDAWRLVHPNKKEYTIEYSPGNYRRLDYAFISETLARKIKAKEKKISAYHLYNVRDDLKLSDHAALVVDIETSV